MNIYDCHLHSRLSFDSREDMENYVRIAVAGGDSRFITTEHMDLESHFSPRHFDIVPDFARQRRLLSQLAQKYPIEMLFGVEAGWRRDIRERNRQIISQNPFDFVIMSVHESERYDVSFPEFRQGRTVDRCYNEYLSLVCEAVESFDDFDTLGHIDYVLRYAGHTDLDRHSRLLKKIFRRLIEKDKALELNTKAFPDPQAVERAVKAVKLYTSMGGIKFTMGSDAHKTQYYKNGFETGIRLLKEHGVDSLRFYRQRKGEKLPL